MSPTSLANVERATGRLIEAAPAESVLASSAALGWRGITAEWHRIEPDEQPEHYVRTHRLMVQTGPPVRFEHRSADGWRGYTLQPGDTMLLPDGTPNAPRWRDTMEFMALGLDPAFVAASFGEAIAGRGVRLNPSVQRQDDILSRLAALLKGEILHGTPSGRLFGEQIAVALSRHLLKRTGSGLREPRGVMTGAQLARVLDTVEANLAADVGLETLAREAGLSAFHFARLFRATTGVSPHQFVLQRRVERARRAMLLARDESLASIALAAGFFDQAHMTGAFRRTLGVTPAALRRDRPRAENEQDSPSGLSR